MTPKQLRDLSDDLFGKKAALNSLHQEIADNFYPERADFTITRSWGTDFAANLMTSYPIQCRRDLGNAFGTMLRPEARPWFHTARRYEPKNSADVKGYLQWFEETQRRAMYDPRALLNRAASQGDHDYAAFGQLCMSIELNKLGNGLLYRAWHLRDVVWQEDDEGQVGFKARRWKTNSYTLKRLFGDRVDQRVADSAEKTPFEDVHVLHMVCDAEMYDERSGGRPRFSVWYDTTHEKLIDAVPIWGQHYIIPRWQTVSGSQYSYSPATVCALPDARLIQAMTFTLLEAAEKATSPPMLATKDAIRGDVALFANGITWVDNDYDERTGEALRPLTQDFRGFEFGVNAIQDTRTMINSAFFLNKLTLPQQTPEMTAFEVGQRVQQYIRDALPLFGPSETEYNAALCDETFELLWRNGAFGPVDNWPKELRQQDGMRWTRSETISFEFESPLHDIIEQQKGQLFTQAVQLIGTAIGMDPACAFLPKAEVALRDALEGIGTPATWLNDQQVVDDAKKKQAADAQAQQKLASLESASNSVKNLGQSGMVPMPAAPAPSAATA